MEAINKIQDSRENSNMPLQANEFEHIDIFQGMPAQYAKHLLYKDYIRVAKVLIEHGMTDFPYHEVAMGMVLEGGPFNQSELFLMGGTQLFRKDHQISEYTSTQTLRRH